MVGLRVLNVTGMAHKGRKLRSYAFCATDHYAPGSIAAVVLNVQNVIANVTFDGIGAAVTRDTYVFGPSCCVVNSDGITLNGGLPLAVAPDGKLPPLHPLSQPADAPFVLQPYAIAFVVFRDAGAAACMDERKLPE